MAKQPEKAVTNKQPEPTKVIVPVVSHDEFGEFAGAGFENVTSKDLLIPRLTILQALSPQVNKREPEYIAGAEAGDICDVAMGQIFKEHIFFLPVHYRKDWLEWAPRSSGKGLVKVWSDNLILQECKLDEKNRPYHGPNIVAETAQFFGFNLSAEDGPRPCFIPMASTQLKRGKKWLNLATGEKLKRADGTTFTPPFFYRTYKLSVVEDSNNDGNWFSWSVERDAALPDLKADSHSNLPDWKTLKQMAVDFKESLNAGQARGDLSSIQPEEPVNGDGERM